MTPQNIIITLVATAFFMEGLDGSIMNTSLPQIAFSLGTTPLHLKLALTSYLLMGGIFIPISGWMADKFGTRIIFCLSIIIFLLGSSFCGFAANLDWLVFGRIIQGIGGAFSIPLARLLLIRNFSKKEFIYRLNTIAVFALIGPSVGPLVGGFLTTFINWRFIFFINLPIGIFALYYVYKYIHNNTNPKIQSFDFMGFFVLAISLTSLLIGLDILTEHSWSLLSTFALIIISLLGLVIYWRYAQKKAHPIIAPKLFEDLIFRKILIYGVAARLALGMLPFMGPLLLQLGLGMSAMASGIYTGATGLAMIASKPLSTFLLKRFRSGKIISMACFLLFFSFNTNILICYIPRFWIILPVLILNGLIASMIFSAINSIIYSRIHDDFQSMGTSFVSAFQQILQSFGIAIGAFILYLFLHGNVNEDHYSVNAFALTYATLSLLPLISAMGFFKIRRQGIEQ
jgi:EmrB/QacA subfamily drug resistance transporter